MKFIKIGKIVNTHGIKGELRILSDFKYKNKVFVPNMKVYVGKNKKEFTINSYRFHKIFDMITFVGFNNINDVEYLKGDYVFINEEDLILDDGEILTERLIDFRVYIGEKEVGKVTEILNTPASEVIRVNENILIPYVKEFIKEVDIKNNILYINDIGGLI